jgi:hypothetical protein
MRLGPAWFPPHLGQIGAKPGKTHRAIWERARRLNVKSRSRTLMRLRRRECIGNDSARATFDCLDLAKQ